MEARRLSVSCRVNGEAVSFDASPQTPLLYALRNDLDLKGARYGCGVGDCGACMVMIDGRPANACDTPLEAIEGKAVRTVEALGQTPVGDALVRAFTQHQAAQCGYCASGVLISAAGLLERNPSPDAQEVRAALDRHLCRCGAHQRIVRAVLSAAEELRHD